MRIFAAIISVVSCLAIFCAYRGCEEVREEARLANIEMREEWIENTISNIEHGETRVSLYSCINTDILLARIEGMQQVESVSFQQTIDLTDAGLQSLLKLPNLNQLEFSGEPSLTDNSLLILSKCKKLKSFSIELAGVTDAGLDTISTMNQLEVFFHYGQFSPEAIESLSEHSPKLKIISMAERQ